MGLLHSFMSNSPMQSSGSIILHTPFLQGRARNRSFRQGSREFEIRGVVLPMNDQGRIRSSPGLISATLLAVNMTSIEVTTLG